MEEMKTSMAFDQRDREGEDGDGGPKGMKAVSTPNAIKLNDSIPDSEMSAVD